MNSKMADTYSYLISQDSLLKSPLVMAFEQPKWEGLISVIN